VSRVDVIVPCYKYGRYLRQCVESVLSQSHGDLRVMIIDDCSPDHTLEVGRELAGQDPRVAYRRHESNRGHIATYNEGLDWADGDYVLLLSADDLLTPGALKRVVKVFDTLPDSHLVFGHEIRFWDGQPLPEPRDFGEDYSWHIISGSDFIESCCGSGDNPVPTPTAVVRTAVLRRIGGYREELPHSADMELWLRLAAFGSVCRIEADQAFKRRHAVNMHHQYMDTMIGDLRQRKAAFEFLFRAYGEKIDQRERLEKSAYRSLGMLGFWEASAAFDRCDLTGCQEYLDFAMALDPGLDVRPEWARFALKRRLGPKVWRIVRPLVTLLRRSSRWARPASV
jgi:glycosyltransferase involved in cell wall biosynthesis